MKGKKMSGLDIAVEFLTMTCEGQADFFKYLDVLATGSMSDPVKHWHSVGDCVGELPPVCLAEILKAIESKTRPEA